MSDEHPVVVPEHELAALEAAADGGALGHPGPVPIARPRVGAGTPPPHVGDDVAREPIAPDMPRQPSSGMAMGLAADAERERMQPLWLVGADGKPRAIVDPAALERIEALVIRTARYARHALALAGVLAERFHVGKDEVDAMYAVIAAEEVRPPAPPPAKE